MRLEWQYHPAVLSSEQRRFIFAIWHNRLALSLLMYRDYIRRGPQTHRLAALVSASSDGGVAAGLPREVATQLAKQGWASHGSLGIRAADMRAGGASVVEVAPGSSAERAGLHADDRRKQWSHRPAF